MSQETSTKSIEVEEDSLALAIALQLQEVETLESNHKGKKRADVIDDCHTALLEYKDVLSNLKRNHLDSKVAEQIRKMEEERHKVITLNRSHAYQFADDGDFARHLRASKSVPNVDTISFRLINTHELEITGSLLDQQFAFATEHMQNRARKLTRWKDLVVEQDKKLRHLKQCYSRETVVEEGILRKKFQSDDFLSQSESSVPTVKPPPLPKHMFPQDFLWEQLKKLLNTDGTGFRVMTEKEKPNSDFTSESIIKEINNGTTVNCIACRETSETKGCIATPCKHAYCPTCVRQLFTRAARDESLFPPRCCLHVFPPEVIAQYTSRYLLEELLLKGLEHVSQRRYYCGEQRCSTFIPLWKQNLLEDIGECPRCGRNTHLLCGQLDHPHRPCKKDDGVHELLKKGEEEKWIACNNCQNMVAFDYGCNHMECR